jgi:hypothetical protein
VASTITEKGLIDGKGTQEYMNTFTLQLNSQNFTTPACSGNTTGNCKGWEQFDYDTHANIVFIQYWLLGYGTCPSGWTADVPPDDNCSMNGYETPLPDGPITAPGLANTILTGNAAQGGNDSAVLIYGNTASESVNPDRLLDLAPEWNTAEFGVFGDGSGSQANFGSNTTFEAQTSVVSNSENAPTCDPESFTAETNNLTREGTPGIGTQENPTIVSQQTDNTPTAKTCASAPGYQSGASVAVDPTTDEQWVLWDGSNGDIWETLFTESGGWVGPEDKGWVTASAPSVAADDAGNQWVFWIGSNGDIWEAYYTVGVGWTGPADRGWAA